MHVQLIGKAYFNITAEEEVYFEAKDDVATSGVTVRAGSTKEVRLSVKLPFIVY